MKLAWASPWLHHSGGTICEPVDTPVNKRHLDMVYAHMRWSDKGFMGSVTAGERAEDSIEMCRILFGADFVDEHCVIMGNINMNSPLTCDLTMTAALRAYASANQCTVVVPFILGGAMGPVTTAGAIAQAHAEAMVGVALTQLVRPGAPVVYGNFLSSMSLKSGAPTFGMPEPALANLAVGQLARRLGVPLRCGGALTASKVPDYQAGQESADALMPAILCGANFILHGAGWMEGALVMDYEKFMLDAEHLGMMHVFMGGLALDDNAFALDAFRENGPGQHFFDCAHTMANYETAFFEPSLSDNTPFEQWEEQGSRDARTRAHDGLEEGACRLRSPAAGRGNRRGAARLRNPKKGLDARQVVLALTVPETLAAAILFALIGSLIKWFVRPSTTLIYKKHLPGQRPVILVGEFENLFIYNATVEALGRNPFATPYLIEAQVDILCLMLFYTLYVWAVIALQRQRRKRKQYANQPDRDADPYHFIHLSHVHVPIWMATIIMVLCCNLSQIAVTFLVS